MPNKQQIQVAYDALYPVNVTDLADFDQANASWLYESRWFNATQLATKWEREGLTHLPAPSALRRATKSARSQPHYSTTCTGTCCQFR